MVIAVHVHPHPPCPRRLSCWRTKAGLCHLCIITQHPEKNQCSINVWSITLKRIELECLGSILAFWKLLSSSYYLFKTGIFLCTYRRELKGAQGGSCGTIMMVTIRANTSMAFSPSQAQFWVLYLWVLCGVGPIDTLFCNSSRYKSSLTKVTQPVESTARTLVWS